MTSNNVSKCTLFIDDKEIKSVTYNDVIKGRTITISTPVEDGAHTWQAECDTASEILKTPVRKFTMTNPVASDVRIESSGTIRGSLTYIFDFKNTADQKPVFINKVAPGDFIEVRLNLPPSKIVNDYYVKQLTSKNDKRYVWLQDQKSRADYYLYEGQNVTVNISSTRFIMSFVGVENNRINFMVYSTVAAQPGSSAGETPEGTGTPAPVETPSPATPPAEPPKAEPPQPAPKPIVQNSTPATDKTRDATPPPSQGFFKGFLSWLSNLFG
jgi:hypothetical protein